MYRAGRYRLRHDPLEIALVRRIVRPGSVAIDIGAHKGAYTYWMAKGVGRSGRVVAFEPQPVLADRLRRSLAGLGLKQVTVESVALSSQSGEAALHVPAGGPSPGASLNESVGESAAERIDVTMRTLDGFLRELDLRPVRLIKCDVEGHELAVFRGAEATLREDRPDLLFECEARHRGDDNLREVFTFLRGLGYEGRFPLDGHWRPLSEFDIAVHQSPDASAYVNNFHFSAVG